MTRSLDKGLAEAIKNIRERTGLDTLDEMQALQTLFRHGANKTHHAALQHAADIVMTCESKSELPPYIQSLIDERFGRTDAEALPPYDTLKSEPERQKQIFSQIDCRFTEYVTRIQQEYSRIIQSARLNTKSWQNNRKNILTLAKDFKSLLTGLKDDIIAPMRAEIAAAGADTFASDNAIKTLESWGKNVDLFVEKCALPPPVTSARR